MCVFPKWILETSPEERNKPCGKVTQVDCAIDRGYLGRGVLDETLERHGGEEVVDSQERLCHGRTGIVG